MAVQTSRTGLTVWSWLRLDAGLWLLRKTVTLTRWLLLAVAVLAAWPVTLVAGIGYLAAWLRAWPAARLYRAAGWALPVTAAGLIFLELRTPGWMTARTPGRDWAHGWDHLAAADLARIFLLLAPVTVPAGLALAGLIRARPDLSDEKVRTADAGPTPTPPWQPLASLARVPARIRRGRPLRMLLRSAVTAALSLVVLRLIPGTAAAPADVFGLIWWFVLTGRRDLASSPER
jgi:hypothetical protein